MARRNIDSRSPDTKNHWAAKDAIEDGFAVEVKFLFESIAVSIPSAGNRSASRISIFIQAENNRVVNAHDKAAYRYSAILVRIVESQCDRDAEILENPDCLEARKRKQKNLCQAGERFATMICLLASETVRRQYQEKAGSDTSIKLIQPYFIEDLAWKRARARLNLSLRTRGVPRKSTVGHGRPPLESRFSRSGNPKGRPPKQSGWAAIKASLDSPLQAKTRSGDVITVSRRQLKLTTIFRQAIEGNSSARRELMMLIEYLHERRLLVEPPPRLRAKKLKLNDAQMEKMNIALKLGWKWSLAHLNEKYASNYGGIVDFEARIGLSDDEKALMEEADKQAEAESAHSAGITTAARAYPTIPRLRVREHPDGSVASLKRKTRAKELSEHVGGQRPRAVVGQTVSPNPTKPRGVITPVSRVRDSKKARKT